MIKQFKSKRGCLSYIISDKKEALIIDPSSEINLKEYEDYMFKNNLSLKYIIDTHTHADHISSSLDLKNEFKDAKIVMHKNAKTKRKEIEVSDELVLKLEDKDVKLFFTPGHTDDSITIYFENALFTGDALLIGTTGRTDFQSGDPKLLYESLWNKILTYPDNTRIYPAHDYHKRSFSTVFCEKQTNPSLQLSKDEFVEMMNNNHPPKPELFDVAIPKNSE